MMSKKCYAAILSAKEISKEIQMITNNVTEPNDAQAYEAMMQIAELNDKFVKDFMDVDPAWTPDKQSSNKPHYYVESYYNCRQNVNYTNIGPATKSDMKHSGDNWFNLNEGFRFDVHDSLRDAITKAGFIANKITFLDLSETESQHANEIVQELMQDETYLEQFRPKNITEILAEISQ